MVPFGLSASSCIHVLICLVLSLNGLELREFPFIPSKCSYGTICMKTLATFIQIIKPCILDGLWVSTMFSCSFKNKAKAKCTLTLNNAILPVSLNHSFLRCPY